MQGESQLVFACGHVALTMLLLSMTKNPNAELEIQMHSLVCI